MSTQDDKQKAPDAPQKLEKGVPRTIVYMFAIAMLVLVWAIFFKTR